MRELERRLKEISNGGDPAIQLQRSAEFLREFIEAYCSRADHCDKAAAGGCPFETKTPEGTVISEISKVGEMLDAVHARIVKIGQNDN